MQTLRQWVPYHKRCLRTGSGTAVVWPFLHVDPGTGPHELFLDTNALGKPKWFEELPEDLRSRCVLNQWPAIQEQWFSNPQFRQSAKERIERMIHPFSRLGARFRNDFAQDQVRWLRLNEAPLRTQFSLIFPYVAIMKKLLAPKRPAEEVLQELEEFVGQDIPRFASALMLAALAALLKRRSRLGWPTTASRRIPSSSPSSTSIRESRTKRTT
jgi:hypothetical protein